jgi:hypothetical protein
MSETPWVPGQDDSAAADDNSGDSDFEPITSQQEFEKRIKGRLNKQAQKYADYDQLRSSVSEAQQKISQLENELNSERNNVLRTQVASSTGVPAHRLSGSTIEEMEASAEQYLAEISELTKSSKPARGVGKSGATGSDNRLDPKEKAAAMLQQMFRPG